MVQHSKELGESVIRLLKNVAATSPKELGEPPFGFELTMIEVLPPTRRMVFVRRTPLDDAVCYNSNTVSFSSSNSAEVCAALAECLERGSTVIRKRATIFTKATANYIFRTMQLQKQRANTIIAEQQRHPWSALGGPSSHLTGFEQAMMFPAFLPNRQPPPTQAPGTTAHLPQERTGE